MRACPVCDQCDFWFVWVRCVVCDSTLAQKCRQYTVSLLLRKKADRRSDWLRIARGATGCAHERIEEGCTTKGQLESHEMIQSRKRQRDSQIMLLKTMLRNPPLGPLDLALTRYLHPAERERFH